LWALVMHIEQTSDSALYEKYRENVTRVCRYLTALWPQPNYDCWEENPDQIHIATLAAIYGGLVAVARIDPKLNTTPVAAQIRDYVLQHGVVDGHFMKYIGNSAVDSSLLWTAVPYGLVNVNTPVFSETLAKIERDLRCVNGGVYRYRADVYYGGGEWLLLAAWLGWVYTTIGRTNDARELLNWVTAQADTEGLLSEQSSANLLAPKEFAPWVARWGSVAKPLLWSHAMFLVLYHALQLKDNSQ